MGKKNTPTAGNKKDKGIEVKFSYKEINNTAQNALEKYLSNINRKP